VDDPSLLPAPRERIPALALRPGYVRSIATEKMGFLSIDIGCGRRKREDTIDFAAGFIVEKNVGEHVGRGEPLAWLCLGDRPAPRPTWKGSSPRSSGSATSPSPRLRSRSRSCRLGGRTR
jgi:thymidine phosphorylase